MLRRWSTFWIYSMVKSINTWSLPSPIYLTTISLNHITTLLSKPKILDKSTQTLIHIIYKFVHEPPIDQVMVIVKLNAANLKIKQLSLNSKVCKPELPLCFSYMSARGHSLQPLKLHHDRSTSDPQLKKTVEIWYQWCQSVSWCRWRIKMLYIDC